MHEIPPIEPDLQVALVNWYINATVEPLVIAILVIVVVFSYIGLLIAFSLAVCI